MRIGRDHIASTVYTIAFAYAGAALPILIIVMLYDRPLGDALTSAELSEEVIRTLVGSVGLVLADSGHHPDRRAGGQGHRHQGQCGGRVARTGPPERPGRRRRRPAAPAAGRGADRLRRTTEPRPDRAAGRPPAGPTPPVPRRRRGRRAACGTDAEAAAARRGQIADSHIAGAGPADLPAFETMDG